MALAPMLVALFEHGRIQVPQPEGQLSAEDGEQAQRLLIEHERVLRLEFPGEAPPLAVPAAAWAATMFYRACQLAVYRDLSAAAVAELLAPACPAAAPAARHWSVDVVFRFLPDLVRHASALGSQDPLAVRLREWAAEWPLSSVGVAAVQPHPERESEIAAQAGLSQLYVDRILAKKDWSRLTHPAVRQAVARSLGAHLPAWPEAAKRLQPSPSQAPPHDAE